VCLSTTDTRKLSLFRSNTLVHVLKAISVSFTIYYTILPAAITQVLAVVSESSAAESHTYNDATAVSAWETSLEIKLTNIAATNNEKHTAQNKKGEIYSMIQTSLTKPDRYSSCIAYIITIPVLNRSYMKLLLLRTELYSAYISDFSMFNFLTSYTTFCFVICLYVLFFVN
jgi:hypothetical protein